MPEDLLKFGMIPEFIGRLPGDRRRARTGPRGADQDPHRAEERAGAPVLRKLFELDGVDLEFSDDALEAIADQAILRGTGARGLRAIMEEVLLSVMYDVPSRGDITKCVITKRGHAGARDPTMVPRKPTNSSRDPPDRVRALND